MIPGYKNVGVGPKWELTFSTVSVIVAIIYLFEDTITQRRNPFAMSTIFLHIGFT